MLRRGQFSLAWALCSFSRSVFSAVRLACALIAYTQQYIYLHLAAIPVALLKR